MAIPKDYKTQHSRPTVKQWFSLDELARAWTVEFESEFTEEYLMELASQPGRILTLGVIAQDWFFYRYDQGKHKDDPHFELLNGFTNLSVHTIKALISAESTVVDWIADCNGGTRCHVCTLGSQKSNVLCGRMHQDLIIPDGPVMFRPLINRHNLKVSDEERRRYEKILQNQKKLENSADSKYADAIDQSKSGLVFPHESELRLEPLERSEANIHPIEFPLDLSDAPFSPTALSSKEALSEFRESETIQYENDEKPKFKPGSWQEKAYQIAASIDPDHKTPKITILANYVYNELKAKGVVNRSKKTPDVSTIEREVLRGWKTK